MYLSARKNPIMHLSICSHTNTTQGDPTGEPTIGPPSTPIVVPVMNRKAFYCRHRGTSFSVFPPKLLVDEISHPSTPNCVHSSTSLLYYTTVIVDVEKGQPDPSRD